TTSLTVTVDTQLNVALSNNSPVCEGDTIRLGLSGGLVFDWQGPNGLVSDKKDLIIPNAQRVLHQGTFSVTVSNGQNCTQVLRTDVHIARPPLPVVTSNSPVCANSKLELFASGGAAYLWTGPAGFSSTEQNPVLSNALGLAPGTYTFTVEVTSAGGCKAN